MIKIKVVKIVRQCQSRNEKRNKARMIRTGFANSKPAARGPRHTSRSGGPRPTYSYRKKKERPI